MKRMTFLFVVLLLAVWAMPMTGWAAESLGKLAENAAGDMPGMAKMVQRASFLAGLVFGVVGVLKFRAASRSQEGYWGAALYFICAIFLSGIVPLIGGGSATIFGSDESSKAVNALGL